MIHSQDVKSYFIFSIIRFVCLLISVAILGFLLLLALPGDPIDLLLIERGNMSSEMQHYLNHYYAESHDWMTHLMSWLEIVFSDSRLMSKLYHKPVFELIFEHLSNTFFLMFTAMLCSVCLAFLFLFICYFFDLRWLRKIMLHFSYIMISAPLFVLCFLGIFIFSITLNIAPSFIHYNVFTGYDTAFFESFILPFMILVLGGLGSFYRYLDHFTKEEMQKLYILAVRAKGVSKLNILIKHVFKNIIIFFLNIFNIRYIQLFSGAVVVESIFNYPGIGSLSYEAIISNDYYLAVTIITTISAFILMMNFLIDVIHFWIDHRVLGATK